MEVKHAGRKDRNYVTNMVQATAKPLAPRDLDHDTRSLQWEQIQL